MKSPSKFYNKDLNIFLKRIVPKNHTSFTFKNDFPKKKYDYILLPNTLSYIEDVQLFLKKLKKSCHEDTRIVVVSFNFLWKPLSDIATFLGLRKKYNKEPNWLSTNDMENIFKLENFEEIKKIRKTIVPLDLGFISKFFNIYIAQLPTINRLCLTNCQIFRPLKKPKEYSLSVIIPARNEMGNIPGIIKKIPELGTKTEVIFVEGHSKDSTYQTIKKEVKNNKTSKNAYLYKQRGIGKADAIKLGIAKSKNEIVIILDADLTVKPKDLKKFYQALSQGACDFANGSRLVYPMEKQAMRLLNYLGNYIFGNLFTYLIGQNIKDTLCGTKAFFKKDYQKIINNKAEIDKIDPFGDFLLLFGATKLNLKIMDIPIRYKERVYGKTNISRFSHGWLLIKMTYFASKEIKFT